MFHVVVFAIYVYVAARLLLALRCAAWWKWLIAVACLPLAMHHLILRTFFGSLASPEVPFAVLAVLGWAFSTLIVLAALIFLLDVLHALVWLMQYALRGPPVRILTSRRKAGLFVVTMALSGFGVWEAVRVPDVREVEITLDDLPSAMDGLTVVQLTDLHLSRLFPAEWARAVVARTNALDPDLILITGDLIDGRVANRIADIEPLRDLRAPLGVVAITGNHEYYSDYAAWMAKFRELGLRVLENGNVAIPARGETLYIAGVTDDAAARFGDTLPDLSRALGGVPASAPTILMAHRPGGAGLAAAVGVDLQLSGHTHGGQVLGLNLVTKAANGGYVSGLYRVGAMTLYVSNGTGLWNGFPVRLGVPSEITHITLRAGHS